MAEQPPKASPQVRPGAAKATIPLRGLWFSIGLASVLLGAIGVVLPLLPTTPFLLLAAYAFARSSQRWHDWLHEHRVFGPMIQDWNQHGAIHRRAKLLALLSIVAAFGISVALQVNPTILIVQAIVLTCVATFILSRPAPPE